MNVILKLSFSTQALGARELSQLGLPHLLLVWGSMYGVMSAMEQDRRLKYGFQDESCPAAPVRIPCRAIADSMRPTGLACIGYRYRAGDAWGFRARSLDWLAWWKSWLPEYA